MVWEVPSKAKDLQDLPDVDTIFTIADLPNLYLPGFTIIIERIYQIL